MTGLATCRHQYQEHHPSYRPHASLPICRRNWRRHLIRSFCFRWVAGLPSCFLLLFVHFSAESRRACMLPNSDLRTPGGNCVPMFHKSSKFVCMPAAAAPLQHDAFALPSCMLPVSLHPSFVFSRRATSSWKSCMSFSTSTMSCALLCNSS